ncbi:unnamed protein product, partial [Mesorhabditis belari]|uniref:Uncharacterized protein n=1 Tax=Mesorhabditis belari TaxID=2138241 RepID=A0AAF3FR67_9BILA
MSTRIAQSSRTTFRSPAFQQIFGRNASYQSARSVTDEAFLSALEMVTHTVGAPQSPMHLTLDGNDYQQLQEIILNNATQDLEIAENDSERFPTLSQIQEQGGSKI